MSAPYVLGAKVDSAVFDTLIAEMTRKPLDVNHFRKNSGIGQSQVFGIAKQRNSKYAGCAMNYKRPELYRLLIELGKKILPSDFTYLSIQVNQNYQTAPHFDRGNRGNSAIVAFGNYSGGELVVTGQKLDIRHQIVFFNGCEQLHSTEPFTGNRFSLVYHTPDRDFLAIPSYSVNAAGNLIEEMNGEKRVFDKKGNVLEGRPVIKMQRKPTLQFCVE